MKQQKILVLSIIILAVALIVFAAACTNIQDSSTITYMADGKEYATITLFGNETPSAPADPDKTAIFLGVGLKMKILKFPSIWKNMPQIPTERI